jgi:multidrug efflux system membrane fusion protein
MPASSSASPFDPAQTSVAHPGDHVISDPITRDPAHLLPAHSTDDAPTPKKPGPWRLIIVVLVLLAAGALIAWRIHSSNLASQKEADKSLAQANRPIPVQVLPVVSRTVPVFLTALGTVTAYNTVTINSRVSGQLLQVNFREGQAVKKGQLLLQIDPRPYQAALDQAIGQLAKDQANLANMEAEAQRYTALYQAGVVSKESQQLQVSNQGQAAGTIKADQAAIEAARVNLGYCRIYSPIDGVVGLRQVDPGNIVNAGSTTSLVVITQIHPISVIFTLPEDQISQVQQAMKASPKALVAEAYDRTDAHLIASGTLLTIDNQIDTTTGTAKLKAVFDNNDSSLFANQFVNVRLVLKERPNAIVVPTASIESGTQGDYVFVVNPGPTPDAKKKLQPTAKNADAPSKEAEAAAAAEAGDTSKSGKQKPKMHADIVLVHVDFNLGTNSVLTSGTLKAGQQVVIDGQEKLVDGGNVTVAGSPKAAAGASPTTTPASPSDSPSKKSKAKGGTQQ